MQNAPQRFGGVAMARRWVDVETIERFLSTKWPATVIEFGTGTGAFSVYLATYCKLNDGSFHTFDTHALSPHPFSDRNDRCLSAVTCLGGTYRRADVFSAECVDVVGDLVRESGGPAFIYCDNGDKPREVAMYCDTLRSGDFLGVHDFPEEITEDDLPKEAFVPWRPEMFEEKGSSNRIMECVA
jgi:hypothetical protein